MYTSSTSRRGRGSGRFANSAPSTPLPPDRDIMEGLHLTSLQTLAIPTITSVAKDVRITDLKSIGSYNWMNASSPTIVVPGKVSAGMAEQGNALPGSSRHWDVFRRPERVSHAIRVLLPVIMAVDKMQETNDSPEAFDWCGEKIDFVTDRNGLRKLMRWIDAAGTHPAPKDFRIDTQLAGSTVLLNRWETRTRVKFSGTSYGFNFEKASTDPALGCEESTGHHRIVKYDLNGLKLVVRFEVDACISTSAQVSGTKKKVEIDDLADKLAGTSLAAKSSTSPSTSSHGLTVLNGGTVVPHSSIVELTTRSEQNAAQFDWDDAYPQLFFSRTPHHFLAVHNRGRFVEVNKRELVSPELQAVERKMQPNLKKLRAALDLIKDIVLRHGQRGRLTLVCRGGKLEVFERTSKVSCLPDEVMARFEN
ncbi:hypothetical protein MVEN_00443800 [Mycena venus]|uniref:Geranylgeranyl pyrophosphate synthetase n=1 Tax=Mycena venus TaxID=2733690 RepID=A0A8H6YVQ9_9AGAR|nr:hypothetical protein MVEN_00443800 [Mycena venus]